MKIFGFVLATCLLCMPQRSFAQGVENFSLEAIVNDSKSQVKNGSPPLSSQNGMPFLSPIHQSICPAGVDNPGRDPFVHQTR